MTTFKINSEYSIDKFDDKNWALIKHGTVKKKGDRFGEPTQAVIGYYGTLQVAWSQSVDHIALSPNTNPELASIISRLEELKEGFIEFTKKQS